MLLLASANRFTLLEEDRERERERKREREGEREKERERQRVRGMYREDSTVGKPLALGLQDFKCY